MKTDKNLQNLIGTNNVRQWDAVLDGRCHLHMGMDLWTADRLIEFVKDQDTPVYVDGDGWNCWGEPVGTDVNDTFTYHVIIPVESPRAGQQLVTSLLDEQFGHHRLRPIRQQSWWPADAVDVIGVVTYGDDWSEYVHHLSWEKEAGRPTPAGVYFSMWPRRRKAYHIEIADDDTGALEDWLAGRSAEVVDVVDIDSGTPGRKP